MSKTELINALANVDTGFTASQLEKFNVEQLRRLHDAFVAQTSKQSTTKDRHELAIENWRNGSRSVDLEISDDMVREIAESAPVAYNGNGRVLSVVNAHDDRVYLVTFQGFAGIDNVSGKLVVSVSDRGQNYQTRRDMTTDRAMVTWLDYVSGLKGRGAFKIVRDWPKATDHALA